jgi:MFS family permease
VALNLPFALSPKEGRGFYLAVCNISVGLGYFAGSLIGGVIAQSISHWTGRVGPFELVNYSVLFFLSGIGRFLSLYFFLRIEEVRKRPLMESVNFMGTLAWTRLQDLAGQGVRIVRRRR